MKTLFCQETDTKKFLPNKLDIKGFRNPSLHKSMFMTQNTIYYQQGRNNFALLHYNMDSNV